MNLEVKDNPASPPVALPKNRNGEIFYPEDDGQPMAETDTHAELLTNLRTTLKNFFSEREDVYVSGNIMFYYVEGDPTEVISPDVLVCFGIPKGDRRSYKVWEENGVVPSVVIELSSRSTWSKNFGDKYFLYEQLGVKEYYIFNPLYPKNSPAFSAFRLENGEFHAVPVNGGRVKSEILGLELVEIDKTLRLFNPETNEYLKTSEELNEQVKELAQRIGEADEENKNLKAEIERLQASLNEKS